MSTRYKVKPGEKIILSLDRPEPEKRRPPRRGLLPLDDRPYVGRRGTSEPLRSVPSVRGDAWLQIGNASFMETMVGGVEGPTVEPYRWNELIIMPVTGYSPVTVPTAGWQECVNSPSIAANGLRIHTFYKRVESLFEPQPLIVASSPVMVTVIYVPGALEEGEPFDDVITSFGTGSAAVTNGGTTLGPSRAIVEIFASDRVPANTSVDETYNAAFRDASNPDLEYYTYNRDYNWTASFGGANIGFGFFHGEKPDEGEFGGTSLTARQATNWVSTTLIIKPETTKKPHHTFAGELGLANAVSNNYPAVYGDQSARVFLTRPEDIRPGDVIVIHAMGPGPVSVPDFRQALNAPVTNGDLCMSVLWKRAVGDEVSFPLTSPGYVVGWAFVIKTYSRGDPWHVAAGASGTGYLFEAPGLTTNKNHCMVFSLFGCPGYGGLGSRILHPSNPDLDGVQDFEGYSYFVLPTTGARDIGGVLGHKPVAGAIGPTTVFHRDDGFGSGDPETPDPVDWVAWTGAISP